MTEQLKLDFGNVGTGSETYNLPPSQPPMTVSQYLQAGSIHPQPESQGTCPNCGYCPHCGRGRQWYGGPDWTYRPYIYNTGSQTVPLNQGLQDYTVSQTERYC